MRYLPRCLPKIPRAAPPLFENIEADAPRALVFCWRDAASCRAGRQRARPTQAGLPTFERHRTWTADVPARFLREIASFKAITLGKVGIVPDQ